MTNWVFRRNRLFGCHDEETKRERERERERERVTTEGKAHERNEMKCAMHEHVTCKNNLHHG